MDFLYSLALKLLYPTSLCLILLLLSAALENRKKLSRTCFWLAISILIVCGNGWLVQGMAKHLEWQHLPPNPVPEADCILVLSGGILGKIPPRPTIEVGEAGDRVLYAAHLFREGKAKRIVCTGEKATGGIVLRPIAEDMSEFLQMIGVPKEAIVTETASQNTHQHAANLSSLLRERGFKRVLLVTSAMHMPRSLGVFQKDCPGTEFIPAPTDFRITERIPRPWYHELTALVPTPANLLRFSEVEHEYLGICYYRIRGWM